MSWPMNNNLDCIIMLRSQWQVATSYDFHRACSFTQPVTEAKTFKGAKAGWFAWSYSFLPCNLHDYGLPTIANFTGCGPKAIFKVTVKPFFLCSLEMLFSREASVANRREDDIGPGVLTLPACLLLLHSPTPEWWQPACRLCDYNQHRHIPILF